MTSTSTTAHPHPHADDLAVDLFSATMKAKLEISRGKGRSGWDDPAQCDVEDLMALLIIAVEKGDLIDVANFAMMAHLRGASCAQVSQALRVHVAMSEIVISADMLEEVLADIEAVSAPIPAQTGIAGGENASIAEGSLAGAGAAPAAGTVDQAAAAMAAESAQLIADAERSVAKRAVAGGLDPLAILSREVHGLSNKLQHPVELTVQLLVLAELRGMGAKHTNTSARLGETAAQAGERLGVAGVLNAISRASSELHR